ncbi:penicillin-binding protein [Solihabitans fulvus]|uniref:Penicillin-binding protein n=1 Tax=Solihabitans fulvus TaxID=1892852 RepID=A0A5B2WPV1_9PSEU|nr:penicillin-binding transpeptidase domain-containing protein [Solihabitans fulvus]KAA2252974.1 penicillin-binding protein [Solihabitans fulvus]
MNRTTRRVIVIGGAVVTVGIVLGAVIAIWPHHQEPTRTASSQTGSTAAPVASAAQTAERFTTALSRGDTAAAATLTDSVDAARKQLDLTRSGMGPATLQATIGQAPAEDPAATTVTVPFTATWQIPKDQPWTYPSAMELRRAGDKWQVHWAASVVNPTLTDGQTLAFRPDLGKGGLLDRNGAQLPQDSTFAPAVMAGIRQAIGGLADGSSWRIVAVNAAGADAAALKEKQGPAAQTVTVTLSPTVQNAAQQAVNASPQPTAIVAIQPSTGEILGVAQNTGDALSGLRPPGSTFKIITAGAVLQAGAAASDTVLQCPAVATVGTRTVPNENKFDLGQVPLHTAFAQSCNTTFAKLGGALPREALPATALRFGLGADFDVPGMTTNTGKVPAPDSGDRQVEDSFGQGDVQTSPFGMALVAATVARGSVPTPVLLRGKETIVQKAPGAAPSPAVLGALRPMMREVVTSGTAQGLAGLGAVYGKTGTAENPQGADHGWFVGYRGDLAFAVLVVGGGSSKVAVTVAASFLGASG